MIKKDNQFFHIQSVCFVFEYKILQHVLNYIR